MTEQENYMAQALALAREAGFDGSDAFAAEAYDAAALIMGYLRADKADKKETPQKD